MRRRHGISEQSFCRWKAKYGGMDVSDAKRLKNENRRLKHIVAVAGAHDHARAESAVVTHIDRVRFPQ